MSSADAPTTRVHADYLLIGGGIAAATAAQTLRDEGATGSILILCAEAYFPYNRPSLTGGILTGELTAAQVLIRQPDDYRKDEIEVRPETAVQAIDPSHHIVVDKGGGEYQYGKLLIATGAKARMLDIPGAGLKGIVRLHVLADALALRQLVVERGPVIIIGTSFIAMETATSLSRMGLAVTLIDHTASVFPKIQSPHLSAFFLDRCRKHGIDVRLGESVAEFRGVDRVSELVTSSGALLQCDTVILAVGVTPQIDFLAGSGIRVDNGVLVDEFLRTNHPDVFAAGDVANYVDRYGDRQRSEHWENARKQGSIAARNMLDRRVPYDDVPHYFCNFLDFSFTFLGDSDRAEQRIARGELESGSFAEFYIRANRIVGLFSTGRPAEETRMVEMLIRQRADVSGAAHQLSDPALDLGSLARATVLILQGGGALGAFECGVVRAMEEAEIFPSIVGGVSVGALNGAIVAANPRNAFQALDAFWSDLSVYAPATATPYLANAFAIWSTMVLGVPDFFRPRWLSPPISGEVFPCQWTSVYDAEPLTHLLKKYVNFAHLRSSPIRLIVGAVDVEFGELKFFDTRVDQLTPAHIIASCSLPPVFRWTTIDGRHYWDGGIISNSPLEHVLSTCGADNKEVVIVDLFPGQRPLPTNLAEVLTRCEEITYRERIRNDARFRELRHDYQALVAEIMVSVDPETARQLKERPRYVHLMGRGATTSIIRIVREGLSQQPPAMDYDFSVQTIARHKQDGYETARRRLPSRPRQISPPEEPPAEAKRTIGLDRDQRIAAARGPL